MKCGSWVTRLQPRTRMESVYLIFHSRCWPLGKLYNPPMITMLKRVGLLFLCIKYHCLHGTINSCILLRVLGIVFHDPLPPPLLVALCVCPHDHPY